MFKIYPLISMDISTEIPWIWIWIWIGFFISTASLEYGKAEKRELQASRFPYLEGKLVKAVQDQDLFVIKKNEVNDVLKEVYDNSGHQCSRYTYKIANDRYYWSCMLKDITHIYSLAYVVLIISPP